MPIIFFFIINKAFETMALVNNICCMKTGTLTENKMQVTDVYIESKSYEPINLK